MDIFLETIADSAFIVYCFNYIKVNTLKSSLVNYFMDFLYSFDSVRNYSKPCKLSSSIIFIQCSIETKHNTLTTWLRIIARNIRGLCIRSDRKEKSRKPSLDVVYSCSKRWSSVITNSEIETVVLERWRDSSMTKLARCMWKLIVSHRSPIIEFGRREVFNASL